MDGQQDIAKFIAWVGRERMIRELTPSEVADYAQQAGLGGSESAQRIAPVKAFLTFLKEQGWVATSLAPPLSIPRSRKNSPSSKPTAIDHLAPHPRQRCAPPTTPREGTG